MWYYDYNCGSVVYCHTANEKRFLEMGITFSKLPNGYSPREVDTYVGMLEGEHTKAMALVDELRERVVQLYEAEKTANEQIEALKGELQSAKKELEEKQNEIEKLKSEKSEQTVVHTAVSTREINDNESALIEAVMSLARANESLAGSRRRPSESVVPQHTQSEADRIVADILGEGNYENPFDIDSSSTKFSL